MAPDMNGLFYGRVLILLLYTALDTYSLKYEAISGYFNWTAAAQEYTNSNSLLARISNVDELCDAQIELKEDKREYWTALMRNSDGQYQWGQGHGSPASIDPVELLDNTQNDSCYAISTSSMKLKSRDCNSLKGVLTTYNETGQAGSNYSDECREYKLSICLYVNTNNSQWKSLRYTWSCKTASGISIGNCKIEKNSFECCEKYCRPGKITYFKEIQPELSVKVRKVPQGFPEPVAIGFDSGDKVELASSVFNDTGRVVVVTLHRRREQDSSWSQHDNFTLSSNVIGVGLRPPYNQTFPNLVKITFSHPKIPEGKVQRKCVFWKEDVWTSNGSWSSGGCSVLDESSLEATVCSCNHLTNFAVLMQFTPLKNAREHEVSLSIITYIGCALSLMGEVLVVFIHVVFMKLKAKGIQIRINLASALFLAQLIFLSGINATNNKPACVLVAVLLHYFFLASFGWMLLEGVYLYVMIVEVFSTVNMRYLYLFAWGFPIIPVVISLVISATERGVLQSYANQNFCWLSFSKNLSWSFIAPVLLVTAINIIILLAVLREIRNLQEPNPSTLKSFKKSFKACIILSPLLGLTWVFGLLVVTDAGLVFQYIFTILNSSQGMLIFLLHVVRNSDVRAEIHHKLQKWRSERVCHVSSANRVHECNSKSISKQNQKLGGDETGHELSQTQTNTQTYTQTGEQETIKVETVL